MISLRLLRSRVRGGYRKRRRLLIRRNRLYKGQSKRMILRQIKVMSQLMKKTKLMKQ